MKRLSWDETSLLRKSERYEKAKEVVQVMADYVNTSSITYNIHAFNDAMSHEHRYLQAEFTQLCIGWLCYIADDDYATDDRNSAAQRLGKLVKFAIDNSYDILHLMEIAEKSKRS